MTQWVKNPPAMQETQETFVQSLCREDPLEEEMATHSNICAGKFHGQRSLAGYSPWGLNELDTAEETNILLCQLVMYACMLSHFRHVRIYAPPWTAAHQAPMSTGFSRQEYWSGLPFPFPPFSNIHVEYLYFNIN